MDNRSYSMPLYFVPEISRRANPHATADATSDPASDVTPVQDLEATRRSSLRGTGRVKQYVLRLRTNGPWLKKFLHGGK